MSELVATGPSRTGASRTRRAYAGRASRPNDARTATAGILLAAAIVVAMIAGPAPLVLLTMLVAAAVALVSPMTGLVVLAFLAPIPRPLVIPPPGAWMLIAGVIVLGLVLRLPIDRPRPHWPRAQVLLAGAFLAYVAAHLVGGGLEPSAISRGFGVADIAPGYLDLATWVLLLAIACVVLKGRSPFPVIAALLASAVLACTAALLPSIGIVGVFDNLVETTFSPARLTGFLGDPNYFGTYLATAATLAAATATITSARVLRVLLVAVAALCSLALLGTLSRGGLVALAVSLVIIAFMRSRRAGVVALAIIASVVIVAYPLYAETRFRGLDELEGAGVSAQLESSGRLDTWLAGVELFRSSPVFGIGFGRFEAESSNGLSAHNWYVSVLAEGGLFGLALWSLFIAAVLIGLRRTSRSARTVGYSVIASWMVASVFLDVPRFYQPTALVVFVVAAALTADWGPEGQRGPAARWRAPAPRVPARSADIMSPRPSSAVANTSLADGAARERRTRLDQTSGASATWSG